MTRLSPEARELLRVVRGADGATGADRARVHGRLAPTFAAGLASGAVAATTSAAASASVTAGGTAAGTGALVGLGAAKVGLAQVALWVAVGVGTGALATASVHMLGTTTSRQAPSPAVGRGSRAAPPHLVRSEARARHPVETTRTADPNDDVPGQPDAGAADLRQRRTRPDSSEGVAASDANGAAREGSALAVETRLLQAAQKALQAGRAVESLRLLDEHAARFRGGVLLAERRATRVLALCQLGRVDEARTEAGALASESPESPVLPRVMRSCAFEP
jgi:hypothetical protein